MKSNKTRSGLNRQLIIDRRYWLRGTGDGSLLNNSGKMCCLGFCAIQNGFTKNEIRGKDAPSDIGMQNMINDIGYNSSGQLLMCTNDSERTTDKVKEHRIKRLFKKLGVSVIFKN